MLIYSVTGIIVFILSVLSVWGIDAVIPQGISEVLQLIVGTHLFLIFSILAETCGLKSTIYFIPTWILSLAAIFFSLFALYGVLSIFYDAFLIWGIYMLLKKSIILKSSVDYIFGVIEICLLNIFIFTFR